MLWYHVNDYIKSAGKSNGRWGEGVFLSFFHFGSVFKKSCIWISSGTYEQGDLLEGCAVERPSGFSGEREASLNSVCEVRPVEGKLGTRERAIQV